MPRATVDTSLGRCAVSWSDEGLTGFQLPEAAAQPTDIAAPPPEIVALFARVQRHFAGDFQDFSDLRYDFTGIAAFKLRVLRAALDVKAGRTATYGEIASAIGETSMASRGVGAALGANRWPLLIPCHRITGAHGRMTGFSGPGGIETKAKLLALEGAQLL